MIFKKNDMVKISGEQFKVIIADEENAVLGKVNDDAVSYENTAIYANGLEFKWIIEGLEDITTN
jgi:hypothetical protein